MKTLAYYLLGIFSLCLLNACSDEDNPTPEPPPSKGQEEVQKIVEVLKESNPEVSQFVEILEKVNVADLTQDKLTVFAVKTQVPQAVLPYWIPLPSKITSLKEAIQKMI